MFFLEEPDEAIKKILLEFNKKQPNLNEFHMKKFLNILFQKEENLSSLFSSNKKVNPEKEINDFHISVWIMMKILHQQYSEIMSMPLEFFNKLCDDLEIITWNKEYDKNRRQKTPDKWKLKGIFWKNNKIIK